MKAVRRQEHAKIEACARATRSMRRESRLRVSLPSLDGDGQEEQAEGVNSARR